MPRAGGALTVLVLAAGQGTRLRSKTIKLLHPVAGQPMLAHVLETARKLRPQRILTVIGFQAERVREALGATPDSFVLQREQRGTGHAVLQASRRIGRDGGTLLILSGDLPTLRPETLRRLLRRHRASGAALSVLTAEVPKPAGYGRIVRDGRGRFERIVEHGDAGTNERRIREINAGVYCADAKLLMAALRRAGSDNAQGEIYLTDAVRLLADRGRPVAAVRHDDAREVLGVNTRLELADATRTLHARKALDVQERGVTLLDAASTRIDPRARIGRDTVIHAGVTIEGPSVIGEDCVIRAGCRIADSRLARGVELRDYCVVLESRIAAGAAVGPFAHLRPGSTLDADARVGNFVELKKARLGRGAKANHLAYLGDADIGAGSNIGAGTITCNYDGRDKHRTTLGRGVFIGSDTQLVAPVAVGDGAYVAAGSTVTEDVPPGALAISRGRQRNVEGWVERRKIVPRRKR